MASENFDIGDLKRRMQGAIQSLKHELGGLRTGRASPSMLDPVQVDAYGSHMPLNQVATISVPEPRLLPDDALGRARVRTLALDIACEIHPLDNLRVLRYLQREMKVSEDDKDRWYRRHRDNYCSKHP